MNRWAPRRLAAHFAEVRGRPLDRSGARRDVALESSPCPSEEAFRSTGDRGCLSASSKVSRQPAPARRRTSQQLSIRVPEYVPNREDLTPSASTSEEPNSSNDGLSNPRPGPHNPSRAGSSPARATGKGLVLAHFYEVGMRSAAGVRRGVRSPRAAACAQLEHGPPQRLIRPSNPPRATCLPRHGRRVSLRARLRPRPPADDPPIRCLNLRLPSDRRCWSAYAAARPTPRRCRAAARSTPSAAISSAAGSGGLSSRTVRSTCCGPLWSPRRISL